jgi:hypothetical protein
MTLIDGNGLGISSTSPASVNAPLPDAAKTGKLLSELEGYFQKLRQYLENLYQEKRDQWEKSNSEVLGKENAVQDSPLLSQIRQLNLPGVFQTQPAPGQGQTTIQKNQYKAKNAGAKKSAPNGLYNTGLLVLPDHKISTALHSFLYFIEKTTGQLVEEMGGYRTQNEGLAPGLTIEKSGQWEKLAQLLWANQPFLSCALGLCLIHAREGTNLLEKTHFFDRAEKKGNREANTALGQEIMQTLVPSAGSNWLLWPYSQGHPLPSNDPFPTSVSPQTEGMPGDSNNPHEDTGVARRTSRQIIRAAALYKIHDRHLGLLQLISQRRFLTYYQLQVLSGMLFDPDLTAKSGYRITQKILANLKEAGFATSEDLPRALVGMDEWSRETGSGKQKQAAEKGGFLKPLRLWHTTPDGETLLSLKYAEHKIVTVNPVIYAPHLYGINAVLAGMVIASSYRSEFEIEYQPINWQIKSKKTANPIIPDLAGLIRLSDPALADEALTRSQIKANIIERETILPNKRASKFHNPDTGFKGKVGNEPPTATTRQPYSKREWSELEIEPAQNPAFLPGEKDTAKEAGEEELDFEQPNWHSDYGSAQKSRFSQENRASEAASLTENELVWPFFLEFDRATEKPTTFAKKAEALSLLFNCRGAWPLSWHNRFPTILVVTEGTPLHLAHLIRETRRVLSKQHKLYGDNRPASWWFTTMRAFRLVYPTFHATYGSLADNKSTKALSGQLDKRKATKLPSQLLPFSIPIWIPLTAQENSQELITHFEDWLLLLAECRQEIAQTGNPNRFGDLIANHPQRAIVVGLPIL